MEFRLHGEIILVHSADCWCQNIWLSPFSHLFSFIRTSQTSCIKLVATALLLPFISCQLSGLPGEQTRAGSYNRLFGGGLRRGGWCLCILTNEPHWICAMSLIPGEELSLADELPLMDSLHITVLRGSRPRGMFKSSHRSVKSNMIPISFRLVSFCCQHPLQFCQQDFKTITYNPCTKRHCELHFPVWI